MPAPPSIGDSVTRLRGATGSAGIAATAGKSTSTGGTAVTSLSVSSLEENIEAANAAIISIKAGNGGDLARLTQHLRELALQEPFVEQGDRAAYVKLRPRLDAVLAQSEALPATDSSFVEQRSALKQMLKQELFRQ
jgi:hypothetical protein